MGQATTYHVRTKRAASRTAIVTLSMIVPVVAHAEVPEALRSHRAVYDVSLDSASERSGINGINGRMVHEVRREGCDTVIDDFRFVTQLATDEFSRLTDQRARTAENMVDRTFRFAWRSYVDEALDTEYEGEAARSDDGIAVTMTEPEAGDASLPAAMFPNEHMVRVLDAARTGERFLQERLYDGADSGVQVMLTTAVIGREGSVADAEADALGGLADEPHWPVTVSYFNESEGGDEMPDYQISFRLHESTVIHDLVLDYGEYVLEGKLAELELLPDADAACD